MYAQLLTEDKAWLNGQNLFINDDTLRCSYYSDRRTDRLMDSLSDLSDRLFIYLSGIQVTGLVNIVIFFPNIAVLNAIVL